MHISFILHKNVKNIQLKVEKLNYYLLTAPHHWLIKEITFGTLESGDIFAAILILDQTSLLTLNDEFWKESEGSCTG